MLSLWAFIALARLVFYYALDLPDTDDLWRVGSKAELSIYSADDELMARRGRRGGQPLRYEDIPADLIQAVTAIEDRRFFDHIGLDPRGLMRAVLANLRAGRTVQGGSTLTQQLAKNVFLTPERSFQTKSARIIIGLLVGSSILQTGYSGAIFQPRLFRRRCLWCAGGSGDLFQPAGAKSDRRRSGSFGGSVEGTVALCADT